MKRIRSRDGQNGLYKIFINILVNFPLSFIFLFLVIIKIPSYFNNIKSTVDPGFYIESYNVLLDVKENGSVHVVEDIDVYWYEGNHHGIYRFIPTWLKYKSKDNRTYSRKAIISNIDVSENFRTTEVSKDKIKVIIGSAYEYVDVGEHTYRISYDYNLGEDPYKGFDEFIFHTFGDYWDADVTNPSLEIRMPDTFDSSKLKLFLDKKRKTEVNEDDVTIKTVDNTIYINFKDDYKLEKSLTVDLELEEGYFKDGTFNYGYTSLTISLAIIIFTIIIFILWLIFGKDYPKEPKTVEFYSPDDLDPAEVGYIIGNQTGKKLVISLILSLASKGYISINQEEKKFIITKLTRRVITVKKENIKYKKKISRKAKAWLYDLFKKSNQGEVTEKFDKFYSDCNKLIKDGYLTIVSDKINSITNKKKLKTLSTSEELVYNALFPDDSTEIDLSKSTTFYIVFEEVSDYLEKDFNKKLEEPISKGLRIASIVFAIVLAILWAVSYFFICDLAPKLSYLYLLSFISLIIFGVLSYTMDRKTKYGEVISARVKGFKNYIATAEKAELEDQVEKNPYYFLAILPFAYSLHVSKKWVEKFENIDIKLPSYLGDIDWSDIDKIDDLTNNISFPEIVSASSGSSSSGGCSSCGGGCSSCGGGCSSCGGGGSW